MANNSGIHVPLPQEEDLEIGPLELSEKRGPYEIINQLREQLADKDIQLADMHTQLAHKDNQLLEKLLEFKIQQEATISEEIALLQQTLLKAKGNYL